MGCSISKKKYNIEPHQQKIYIKSETGTGPRIKSPIVPPINLVNMGKTDDREYSTTILSPIREDNLLRKPASYNSSLSYNSNLNSPNFNNSRSSSPHPTPTPNLQIRKRYISNRSRSHDSTPRKKTLYL